MTLYNEGLGVIRKDDKSSHGGVVISASGFPDMGKAIALVGDLVKCPKCKGTFPIVEGAQNRKFMGKPMAFHGHKTACGAILISSYGVENVEPSETPLAVAPATEPTKQNENADYDEHFAVVDQHGAPAPEFSYAVRSPQGEQEGETDTAGKTQHIYSDESQQVELLFAVQKSMRIDK
jgi:uncharacterized Zn-binding protein involved in type VI secretion